MDEVYGKSEALAVLDDVKAFNELPIDEQVYARARHVEDRLGFSKDPT